MIYMYMYIYLINFMLSLYVLLLSMMLLKLNLILIMNFKIYTINMINLTWTFYMDWMGLMMTSLIMYLFSMIIFFSFLYMKNSLFTLLMFLFKISMILMVLNMNFFFLLYSWDMLGILSVCLVYFFNNNVSLTNGMNIMIINRFSDMTLMMSMMIMMSFNLMNNFSMNKILMIMMILSFMIKSTQFPFIYWLPMAMSAPLPVSALVHSSTLVITGIYEIMRFNEYLNLNFIMFMSWLTLMISFINLMMFKDMKKIMAFSTMNHMSMMMFMLSINITELVMIYLMIHALFKSLMFLCMGMIINNNNNKQNYLLTGMMMYKMPMFGMIFLFSMLMMTGFPYMIMFYCKDMIMDFLIYNKMNFNIFLYLMMLFFTNIYMMNLMINLLSINNLNFNINKETKLYNYSMLLIFLKMILYMMFLYNMFYFNIIMMNHKIKIILILMMIMFNLMSLEQNLSSIKINLTFKSLFYIMMMKKILTLNLMNLFLLIKLPYYWNEYLNFMNINYLINFVKIMEFEYLNKLKLYMMILFIYLLMMKL